MASVELLRTVALFSQLREEDLERLRVIMHPQTYPKNRVILSAHRPCDTFFVLIEGQVKVMLVAEDGREVILSLIRTGDFFGERSLLDEEPHAASVIAMEESRMLVLHRDDFRRCISEIPGVAVGLLRALLGRLREADHRIGGLILLDAPGRVARLLLQLADLGDGETIANPLTQQVLAQMVGTTRETVSRTMKALADQGVLTSDRDRITIQDRRALEVAAGQLLRTVSSGVFRRPRRNELPPPTDLRASSSP